MNIGIVLGFESQIADVMEKIKKHAFSMGLGIGEIVPVNRPIDIPIAVRRLSERADIDSVLVMADFIDMNMEHDLPLSHKIRSEIKIIEEHAKKPVFMEIIDKNVERYDNINIEKIFINLKNKLF